MFVGDKVLSIGNGIASPIVIIIISSYFRFEGLVFWMKDFAVSLNCCSLSSVRVAL